MLESQVFQITRDTLQCACGHPYNSDVTKAICLSLAFAQFHDALQRHESPYVGRLDEAYRHLVSLGRPVPGHADKRSHLEPSDLAVSKGRGGVGGTRALRRPAPRDSPALAIPMAVPAPTGTERLSALLHAHPPYLRKALLRPKPAIFDPLLRIFPSPVYSIPKSHNELLEDVRGTINPLLCQLQTIITEQDDLIKQLSATPAPPPQLRLVRLVDCGTSTL
ncbi:hypothetical protein DFJ73DRAFT_828071, partial [Zopfochytrium polystomum]